MMRKRAATARACQRGYLYEVPVLLALLAVLATMLFPVLSPPGRLVLEGLCAAMGIGGAYYVLVAPGWTARRSGRGLPTRVRRLLLLVVATACVALALRFRG